MPPELSMAMHHFKETEEGSDEMCKAIEEFADERALNTAIDICIECNSSLEETIRIVKKKFKDATVDYITSMYNMLSHK